MAEKHFSFFCNSECEYFPCHKTDDRESFNCLFCYCPLYTLGRLCGGHYAYLPGGVKDCSHCLLPTNGTAMPISSPAGRTSRRW